MSKKNTFDTVVKIREVLKPLGLDIVSFQGDKLLFTSGQGEEHIRLNICVESAEQRGTVT